VQPSLYEGFGLTALEAMHHGVPVIAARSRGLLETCGQAALTFAPDDALALAAALARVSADHDLRGRLGRAGRARASAFSWQRSARAHLAAYSLALDRRRLAPGRHRTTPQP
jgi:glycosyltransferase involved in cell wall biosynthesis